MQRNAGKHSALGGMMMAETPQRIHAQQQQASRPTPFVVQVLPLSQPHRAPAALEQAMHTLALDARHPVALELTGAASRKRLLVRATTPEALAHAEAQLLAHAPQAGLRPLVPDEDPLRLNEGEVASVVELAPAAAAYLPLQTWQQEQIHPSSREGLDPVASLLASFDHLPQDVRALAQLALAPASSSWGASSRRKALEHPLERERLRQRAELSASAQGRAPSRAALGLLALVLGLLMLWQRLHLTPPLWMGQALSALLHGRHLALSGNQVWQLLGLGSAMALLTLCLLLLSRWIQQRCVGSSLDDPRLVAQKTMQIALRVRLRLYVI